MTSFIIIFTDNKTYWANQKSREISDEIWTGEKSRDLRPLELYLLEGIACLL